ncbi:MAG: PEP/pyruvate-binding domain-containing protein, partial [Actinomycetota bacterium]
MGKTSKNEKTANGSGPAAGFWLDLRDPRQLERADIALVGGKAANLAKLIRLGLPTPKAVVLTSAAWHIFLENSGTGKRLDVELENIESRVHEVEEPAQRIAALLGGAKLPGEVEAQIAAVYADLSENGSRPLAIRSSGSYEDSPTASFSGMLSSVLGVSSLDEALAAVRKCWLSGFSPRSLRYLAKMGLNPAGMSLAVIFQQMVEAGSSGVLFTVDPATGDSSVAVVEAAYGYGPGVVSGNVTPDLYRIEKKSREIIHRDSRPQEYFYSADGSRREVEAGDREEVKLADDDVLKLVDFGVTVENELGAPQDVEWCRGPEGIVLLQTRPITGLEKLSLKQKQYTRPEVVMVRGIGVSPRIGWGEILKVDIDKEEVPPVKGKVVLVRTLTQDLASHLKDAAAVVADEGGATSHGANILREFQIPCVVGTRYGQAVMHAGDIVTVDGWRGLVLDGIGPRVREREFGPEQLVETRTRLMTTINVPESAEKAAAIADGVISFRNDYLLLQGGVPSEPR